MTKPKHPKSVYSKPLTEQISMDGSTLLAASDDGTIVELPPDTISIFPDEDGKNTADALSKGGTSLWDDWDDADK